MSARCNLASCRRDRGRLNVRTITRCTRNRREEEHLVAVITKLDAECYATKKRIENEMRAIQKDLNTRVKRVSRPLSSLEIPQIRPPPYAEAFHAEPKKSNRAKD